MCWKVLSTMHTYYLNKIAGLISPTQIRKGRRGKSSRWPRYILTNDGQIVSSVHIWFGDWKEVALFDELSSRANRDQDVDVFFFSFFFFCSRHGKQ